MIQLIKRLIKKQTDDILTSISNPGLIRKNNEDSAIVLKHPLNNNIKLLAVADGIGGNHKGEYASQYVIERLCNWFINENINTFSTYHNLYRNLYNKITTINNELYIDEYNKSRCGTTLTCAIVTEKETIVANIGDSRAYILNNNEIKQVTKDDSLVWQYYEKGILSKDELRFHINSSLITKCIGHEYNVNPTISRINNNDYNCLLLLTDGITDCLSDKKIKFIVDKNNGKNIAKALINESVYKKQNDNIPKGIEFKKVRNGKDNATVALYVKCVNQK